MQEHAFSLAAIRKTSGSPTWHRRARRTRSKARSRCRLLRSLWLPLRGRDLARLASHHSSPFPTLMGKPKEWKGHGGVKSWEQASERSWSIWPGAYSPQAPWRPKGGKGMTRDQGIPGYATRKPQEEPPQSTALISAGGTSVKEGLVPTIQHALNCTRKAEAKVKKIQDDKEKHIQMWKTWEADMKAAWLREKKRFAAESERLEREAAESLQAQEDARCNLRAAFEGCYSNDAAATKAMEVEDADNNAEWEAMMAGWNQEAQPDWGSVLQRGVRRQHTGETTTAPANPTTTTTADCADTRTWTFGSCPVTCVPWGPPGSSIIGGHLRPVPGHVGRCEPCSGASIWYSPSWIDATDFDQWPQLGGTCGDASGLDPAGTRAWIWAQSDSRETESTTRLGALWRKANAIGACPATVPTSSLLLTDPRRSRRGHRTQAVGMFLSCATFGRWASGLNLSTPVTLPYICRASSLHLDSLYRPSIPSMCMAGFGIVMMSDLRAALPCSSMPG